MSLLSSCFRQLFTSTILWISVRRVISVGCAVSTSSSERDSTAFDGGFVEVWLVFQFTKGAGNDFRVAGRFAVWRNAVVLLSGVCRVQELAEGAGNGQQLIVREVLQGGEQLLTTGLVTGTGRFGQLADGFNAVEDVLPNASLMVSPSTLPSMLTLLRNAEYCSFIKPSHPIILFMPGENLLDIILSSPL